MAAKTCKWLVAVAGSAALAVGLVGGCIGEASSYVGEREVSATSTTLGGATVRRMADGTVVCGLRPGIVQVSETDISWGEAGKLMLPPAWKRVDLHEAGTHIDVRVDGKKFGSLDPAA